MKVRKNSAQKSIILDNQFYTSASLTELLQKDYIFRLDDDVRISLDALKELKVVYNKEDGFYGNVAIGKDGTPYHVLLF